VTADPCTLMQPPTHRRQVQQRGRLRPVAAAQRDRWQQMVSSIGQMAGSSHGACDPRRTNPNADDRLPFAKWLNDRDNAGLHKSMAEIRRVGQSPLIDTRMEAMPIASDQRNPAQRT